MKVGRPGRLCEGRERPDLLSAAAESYESNLNPRYEIAFSLQLIAKPA